MVPGEATSGGRDHLRNRGLLSGGGWNLDGAIVKVTDWLEALTVAVFFILVIVPSRFHQHFSVSMIQLAGSLPTFKKSLAGRQKKVTVTFDRSPLPDKAI